MKDVEFALSWKMVEFRAVGGGGLYRLRRARTHPWPTLRLLARTWNLAEVSAYAQLAEAIDLGRLTAEEADVEYWHRVCRLTLPRVGLMYRREVMTQ